MIFKPFVLLASVLAPLHVAHGVALAKRDDALCCMAVLAPPLPSRALTRLENLLKPTGVTLNTSLDLGAGCTPRTGTTCTTGTSLNCQVTVLLGTLGVNCVTS
ncbi:hypothetical protein R3P38DRAFT_496048 [Favolaschia claudopus]|uniref:Hydrophobin n=1 Tax=Favolaschia claudopus TaxID=2862362 RepID=A0AAW0CM43_9AGAR